MCVSTVCIINKNGTVEKQKKHSNSSVVLEHLLRYLRGHGLNPLKPEIILKLLKLQLKRDGYLLYPFITAVHKSLLHIPSFTDVHCCNSLYMHD